ncbi:MAG: glycoside hydrolase family 3 protein [Oscillospiraceae bacterium]|nr:glycoside hydrolase family 3 protein [Oscillospiraceae bacterium]
MKEKKPLLSIIGIALSVLTAVMYAVLYGKTNSSMDSMSWPAFWVLMAGALVALALVLLKKPRFGSYLMTACHLAAFMLAIYAFYPYISAAFVGIDSTWEVPFFVVMALFVAGLAVNAAAAFTSMPVKSAPLKTLCGVMAALLALTSVGGVIANENAPQINGALKTASSVEVHEGSGAEDTMYYKSAYSNLAELMAAGRAKAQEAMAEGIVLLRNENGALPMSSGSSVTLFGVSSVDPVYGGTGSGNVDVSTAPNWKTALEQGGSFKVNSTLWDWYSAEGQAQYKRTTGSTGPGVTGAKSIGEAPWSAIKSAAGSTFAQYGDAALVFISRLGGEGSDMPRGTLALSKLDDVDGSAGDTTDGDYLKLSPKEKDMLLGLKAEKDAGTLRKIIVVLNFANQVEADFLDDAQYGIDAALWIGTPGQVGMYAVADVLCGKVNPSGSLSATFWRSHDKNPALANFGATAYAGADGVINTDGSPQQDKYYVVYQEGIYVGYRYTESRYEDYVMGTGNAGSYSWHDAVAFPFGFGLSYTSFEWSGFKVEKSGSGVDTAYTVSVTVTNTGSAAGKETVQVYLQKPYGDYNKANHVEASSAELAGFGKTKLLEPGQSETVTVTVYERQFAAYDAWNANTYVIVEGDYYLTAARDAHRAVNNILAKKGFTPASTDGRMDSEGDAALTSGPISLKFDKETYSKSYATGYNITNQFEYAEWNKYEHRGDDTVTYMSRSDWEATTPKTWADTTVLHWNQYITADQDKYGRQSETKLPTVADEYPKFDTVPASGALKLIDLKTRADGSDIPYDDPMWDTLLDQLSWEDYTSVIPSGMRRSGQIEKISKMECLDHNGPSGLTQNYMANKRGLATVNDDPDKKAKAMCYPSGGILAASFNVDLLFEVGDLIGEDALWAGYNGLYGPGSNIQRTPYSGRNFEYYSEDGYLSGMICAYECAAMESHGLYVYNKHIGLNDQEDLRRGICTWAPEQAIREVYMRAFELPITIAGTQYKGQTLKGASGVMLAFNRMGLHWSGMQKGMVTEFLRNECGMTGIVVTDMWYGTASTYMNLPALLVAGGNLVDGMMKAEDLDACRPGTGHADVAWGMREAMHRILYTVVHSNAMNGVSSGTRIMAVTPWWQTAITAAQIGTGVLTLAAVVLLIIKSRKNAEKA